MKNKVTMNERGVITIPAALRKAFGLKANDELIVEETQEGILLRPVLSVPIELYTEERIDEFAGDEEDAEIAQRFLPFRNGTTSPPLPFSAAVLTDPTLSVALRSGSSNMCT